MHATETSQHAHEHHDHEGHDGHDHHEMPTSGRALNQVALSATLHCLTGCAIGEVLGMVIGTAAGFSEWGTVALAVSLAFLFGYGLTSLPLLRAGFTIGAVVPIALAADTLSIATMEIVDNAVMLAVPGAMEAGVSSVLFWGSLSFALVVAGMVAVPVNRYLIRRGRGHAVVHETGIHGGPDPKLVGAIAVVAFVFGSTVLLAEWFDDDGAAGGHGGEMAQEAGGGHGGGEAEKASGPTGLAASQAGLTLRLDSSQLPSGRQAELAFRVAERDGRAVRDFEVEQEKRMHAIVVRRDLTGFQHLHPRMDAAGTWRTPIRLAQGGDYRVFADFRRDGEARVLARDLRVEGPARSRPLPEPATTARTASGYDVRLLAEPSRAGRESTLRFAVARDGRPVTVEPYLGAGGHLVALREGDLAYLHTHPRGNSTTFDTEFPTAARYRLFLQFQHDGRVHTAAFTRAVG